LIISFPADLESSLEETYHETVSVYFNQNETQSSSVASRFTDYLTTYQEILRYLVHGNTSVIAIQAGGSELDQNKMIGEMMAMLLPMLVVMFLFSGAMSIGPESIAGEKERGTMATLLITPVKRSQIALGKVMSLGILSLISAFSSFIGIISSLPKMMGLEDIDIPYDWGEYALILVLLFSTVFVIVGIIAVVSAYAKNLKEAGTLIMPIYMVTIFIGITSMFGDGAVSGWWFYLIPIYNTVQSLTAILVFDPLAGLYVLLTILSNLVVTGLLVWLLDRMFKSERIMFAK
jgi:sodium transport system permease protein